jgi:hypothetical protein
MNRIGFGVLVLLLAWPALRGDDKAVDKDKPPTPKEQYQSLLKETQQAQQDFMKSLRAAKSPNEQQKAIQENTTRTAAFAARFVALAEKAPKDPVALDALTWVVQQSRTAPEKNKALDLLARDHLQSDKLGPLCQNLARAFDSRSEQMLRRILAKNPHKSVQAEASLALAQRRNTEVLFAKRLKDEPQLAQQLEAIAGKDVIEELAKADVAALEAATKKAYEEFADKYSADLPAERLTNACQRLSFEESDAVESFLRALEKDKRREVQGIACLTLAQVLKHRAESTYEKDAKAAKKLSKESEELFSRAADKYGDVKLALRGGTVGDKAQTELYELRHMAVGMIAPDIAGEDQDGKPFKLSDYKGKVVLLDFWSEF